MVMLTNVCGVGQYKIEIDQAILTNNSECAKSTVNENCMVCAYLVIKTSLRIILNSCF